MVKLSKTEQQQYDICLGQCTMCLQKVDCELRIKVKELRILTDSEKLSIAVDFLDDEGFDEYMAECERKEREG